MPQISPDQSPPTLPYQAREAAGMCARCGACQAVCPVYQAGRREVLSARGKLRLVDELARGVLAPDRRLARLLTSCLLCGRCQANCPNLTPATEGLRAVRAVLSDHLTPTKRLAVTQVLPRPRAMSAAAAAGRLALGSLPPDSGLRLRGLAGLEHLPLPASRPFLARVPRVIPGPKGSPRLGLFAGCVGNHLRPELLARAVHILSRGFSLVIPPQQGCCGLPAVAAGLEDTARTLARRNLAAFRAAGVERVVTTCGSCAHALAHELPRLAGETLPGGVVEISQVLADHPKLIRGSRAHLSGPVALHHPCHLGVGLGVTEEPRAVLAAAGVEIAPMAGEELCCGGGGLFMLSHPELSRAVFAPRARAFQDSGARTLATSCSGCYLQWRRGLGPETAVVHPLELLA